jgi:hypothetical protein
LHREPLRAGLGHLRAKQATTPVGKQPLLSIRPQLLTEPQNMCDQAAVLLTCFHENPESARVVWSPMLWLLHPRPDC